MSALTDSPAYIVRQMLVNLGVGATPSQSGTWPIYDTAEPDLPDNCITVYDTPGNLDGRLMGTGAMVEYHGIQIRVRATTHEVGSKKARDIAYALDELVYHKSVTVGANNYTVQSVSRTGAVNSLGKEVGVSKRKLFTLNATVNLWQNT